MFGEKERKPLLRNNQFPMSNNTIFKFFAGLSLFFSITTAIIAAVALYRTFVNADRNECNVDSDCGTVNNPCQIFICNDDKECSLNLTSTAECSSSTECSSGFCNSTCMCDIKQCNVNSDCGTVDDPCQTFICDGNNMCSLNLTSTAECSSSTGCSSGICNSTCMCEPIDSDIETLSYTPELTPIVNVAWDIANPQFIFALYKDLGDYVEVTLNFRASQTAITVPAGNIVFDFSLPILGNSAAAETGFIIATCGSLTANPTQCVSCSGLTFIASGGSTGRVLCANQNPSYTGPSSTSHTGDIFITLLYEKA